MESSSKRETNQQKTSPVQLVVLTKRRRKSLATGKQLIYSLRCNFHIHIFVTDGVLFYCSVICKKFVLRKIFTPPLAFYDKRASVFNLAQFFPALLIICPCSKF